MSNYTAVCVKKITRDLIHKLATVERRTLGQIVALAIEARYKAMLKGLPSSSKVEESQS